MRAALAVAALLSACGGDDRSPGPDDAGPDDDAATFEPTVPAPPAAPAPPHATPCPEGWHEAPDPKDPAIVACEPWARGARTPCDPAQAWFPGGDRCAPIGSPCPAGDFADDLPGTGVVYVLPGAAGDGSPASPFGTIAEGFAAAADGATIALGRGTHAGGVVLDRPITIRGACPGETIIEAPDPAQTAGTVEIAAAGVVLRDLSVTGPRIGIRVDGGEATLGSVVVRGAERVGVRIAGGATVTATDLVVRDTQSQAGLFGIGVQVSEGAALDLVRGAVDDNRDVGIFVFDAGSVATLADVVSARTLVEESTGRFGYGMSASTGGHIEMTRTIVERGDRSGIYVEGGGVVAEDVVVRDERVGDGVFVGPASDVSIARATIDENEGAAVHALGDGTHVDATDVVLRGNRLAGVQTFDGASLSLERAFASGNFVAGLVVGSGRDTGLRASLDLVDVRIVETQVDALGDYGFGVESTVDSDVRVQRVAIESAHSAGILLTWGSTLSGTDLVVSNTLPRASGRGGYGMETYAACEVDLARVLLDGSRAFGLIAFDPATRVSLEDLTVSGTLRDESGTLGTGLCALDGASIAATRFRLSDNVVCGLQIARDGTADLEDGVISGSLVGANVQVDGYDLARLQNAVVYRDNGTNLDTQALPVPGSGETP